MRAKGDLSILADVRAVAIGIAVFAGPSHILNQHPSTFRDKEEAS
jgi:hypothetical protein